MQLLYTHSCPKGANVNKTQKLYTHSQTVVALYKIVVIRKGLWILNSSPFRRYTARLLLSFNFVWVYAFLIGVMWKIMQLRQMIAKCASLRITKKKTNEERQNASHFVMSITYIHISVSKKMNSSSWKNIFVLKTKHGIAD